MSMTRNLIALLVLCVAAGCRAAAPLAEIPKEPPPPLVEPELEHGSRAELLYADVYSRLMDAVQRGVYLGLHDVGGVGTYEIHSKKSDTDIKVGDILTLEGGLGKSFYKKVDGTPIPRVTTVGLAHYGQYKVSADSIGPGGTRVFDDRKDRVFGIGGEVSVFLPKPKLLIDVRIVPEFAAVNRTEGPPCVRSRVLE
jgi:hypothetical protein